MPLFCGRWQRSYTTICSVWDSSMVARVCCCTCTTRHTCRGSMRRVGRCEEIQGANRLTWERRLACPVERSEALLLTRTASAWTGEPPVPREQQSDRT